jgi:hypothetical protein
MAVRALTSWLVVAAVALLVAAAALDAVRTGPRPTSAAHTTRTVGPARVLAAAGIRGGVLTIAGPGCRLRGLRMPTLAPEQPAQADCGGIVWNAEADLGARCRGKAVELFSPGGEDLASLQGCAPAWRPGGWLTLVRRGAVVEAPPLSGCVPPCSRVLLSRQELGRELAGQVADSGSYRIAAVDWIDSMRFAALLRGRRPWQQAVAVFAGPRLEMIAPQLGQRLSGLRASSRGYIAVLRSDLGRDALLLDRNGGEVPLPRLANVRAFTWSPSERWIALATRTGTYIARTGEQEVIARIPLGAEALAWR